MSILNSFWRTGAIGLLSIGTMVVGSSCASKPDQAAQVRQSLKSAGYKDISVTDDHDKGVVTLSGKVASDADKAQANSIARSIVVGEVVANEVAVVPSGVESQAKTINSDVDKGIRDNLDAALVQQNLHKAISYTVNNGVVTLTGNVASQQLRNEVQVMAAHVPYVQQVVNEIQVKGQKASSTN
jgi:osmotically-inducible protein OsmY